MTQSKNTKRALLASVLSLVLCVTMLIGSTFAWFTDTATTGVNKITAGNLDVGLEYSTDMQNWENAENASEIFGAGALWEPGYTQVLYFRVSNNGNLALKYKIGTNLIENIIGKTSANTDIDLTKYIKFGIVENVTAKYADRAAARNAVTNAVDFGSLYLAEKSLLKDEKAVFAMVAYMPEDVNNEANHNGTDVPSIKFGVNVIASQLASESDSYGSDYDLAATFPQVAIATLTINEPVVIASENFEATIPANAGLTTEDGETIAEGTTLVMEIEENTAVPSNIVIVESDIVLPYSITLETSDGEKVESQEPITVKLDIGAGRTGQITLYHYDTEVTGTSYDEETGILTFTATDFSPYTVVESICEDISWYLENPNATEYVFTNPSQLMGLAAMYNTKNGWYYLQDKTFKLGNDIDLRNVEWTPIGDALGYYNTTTKEYYPEHFFKGVFDGQGYTISNLNVSNTIAGSTGKYSYDCGNGAGFFGNVVEGTIKNVNFNNAAVYADKGNAAVVAGYAYYSTIENIKVTGDITVVGGWQGIGTIVGWANVSTNTGTDTDDDIANGTPLVTISNIKIDVNAGSKVECLGTDDAGYKDYTGGIWGRGIPKTADTITSNIDVYATSADYAGLIGGYKADVATNATSTGTLYVTE